MPDNPKELLANIAPFGLRMQPDLRDRVKASAEKNNRSMNSEIIARLEDSLSSERGPTEIYLVRELVASMMIAKERSPTDVRNLDWELEANLILSGLSPRPMRVAAILSMQKSVQKLLEGTDSEAMRRRLNRQIEWTRQDALQRMAEQLRENGWKVSPSDEALLDEARKEHQKYLKETDRMIAKADELLGESKEEE